MIFLQFLDSKFIKFPSDEVLRSRFCAEIVYALGELCQSGHIMADWILQSPKNFLKKSCQWSARRGGLLYRGCKVHLGLAPFAAGCRLLPSHGDSQFLSLGKVCYIRTVTVSWYPLAISPGACGNKRSDSWRHRQSSWPVGALESYANVNLSSWFSQTASCKSHSFGFAVFCEQGHIWNGRA